MKAFVKKHLNVLSAAAVVAIVAVSAFAGSARDKWEQGADRRKADYIFMEALRQKSLDNLDAYFELYRRAYELDTTSTSIGQDLGYYYMVLGGNDSTLARQGYEMMRRHFDAVPDDYYSAIFYGQINERIGNRDEALRVWQTLDSLYPGKPELSMRLAETLGDTNDSTDLRRTLDILNRIERSTGKNLAVTSQRVRTLLALKDTAAITKELHGLIESSPWNADSHVYAGDVYMALNQRDSAIIYYNRACEVDSTSGLAYYRRADYYRQTGDSIAYDREVFRALEQENLDLEVKNEILTGYVRELYQDSLQRPRITSLFELMLQQHPHEIQVRETYAAYLAITGNYSSAAEQLDYALDIDPSAIERWRSAIAFHLQAEEYDRALRQGDKALSYHPGNPDLHLINGTSLMMAKRPVEAIPVLQKAFELTDSLDRDARSTVMTSIGDAYYQAENADSAFICYERALELNPANLLAMNNCAYHLAVEGKDLDRAERLSAVTVREDPQNPTTLDTYAWIFFKKKNYAMARDYINRAIEYDPDPSEELLEHAGDIYFMNGEPDEAVDFWEKALEKAPDNELLQRKVKHKTYFYK